MGTLSFHIQTLHMYKCGETSQPGETETSQYEQIDFSNGTTDFYNDLDAWNIPYDFEPEVIGVEADEGTLTQSFPESYEYDTSDNTATTRFQVDLSSEGIELSPEYSSIIFDNQEGDDQGFYNACHFFNEDTDEIAVNNAIIPTNCTPQDNAYPEYDEQFVVQDDENESFLFPAKPRITRVELLVSMLLGIKPQYITESDLMGLITLMLYTYFPLIQISPIDVKTKVSMLFQLESHFSQVISALQKDNQYQIYIYNTCFNETKRFVKDVNRYPQVYSRIEMLKMGICILDAILFPFKYDQDLLKTDTGNVNNQDNRLSETEFTNEDLIYHLNPFNGSVVYDQILMLGSAKDPVYVTRIQALVYVYICVHPYDLVVRDYFLIADTLNQMYNLNIRTRFNITLSNPILCELDRHYDEVELAFKSTEVLSAIIRKIHFNEKYLGKLKRTKLGNLKEKYRSLNPDSPDIPMCAEEEQSLNLILTLFHDELGLDNITKEQCLIIYNSLAENGTVSYFASRNVKTILIRLGLNYDKVFEAFLDTDFVTKLLNKLY